jgi:DNA-binding CsgD family transcriptional regulator
VFSLTGPESSFWTSKMDCSFRRTGWWPATHRNVLFWKSWFAGPWRSKERSEMGGGTLRITRQHGRSLHIRIAPFPSEHSPGGSRFEAIALIGDPDRAQRLPFETMRSVYGLTPAEARLALLLLDGKTIAEAADEHEVTKDTVRSQLKSLFLKTGTRRQGMLIGLLASIPGEVR